METETTKTVSPTAVYSDGGMIPDGGPVHSRSTLGGTFAWVQVDAFSQTIVAQGGGLILPRDYAIETVTNNLAELIAMLNAIEEWPAGVQGVLYTDSEVTLNRVFGNWALNELPPDVIGWVRRVKRGPKIDLLTPALVAGHPTALDLKIGYNAKGRRVSIWNVLADQECQRFAQQYRESLDLRKGVQAAYEGGA